MNIKSLSTAAALIAALGSSTAWASDEYALNQNLPAAATAAAMRAEVRAVALNDYQRNLNSVAFAPSELQRVQVLAEAIEARKLGLLVNGEVGAPAPTAAQLEQIHLAGLRAVSTKLAAK